MAPAEPGATLVCSPPGQLPPIRFTTCGTVRPTVVLAAGQSIKVISEILGHATSAFTADVYIEVVEQLADSVAAAVAAYIPRRDKPGAVTP